jgi:hypothetical protein
MRAKTGWTLTDHADRLAERHRTGRLPGEVEQALSRSYLALPTDLRRMLRLLALHPGRRVDVGATAALAGIDRSAAASGLQKLNDNHLMGYDDAGGYALHVLVRAFAVCRGHDEDRPADHEAALTRLSRSDSFGISPPRP